MVDVKKIISDALDVTEVSIKADRINLIKLREALGAQLNDISAQIVAVSAKIDAADADIAAIDDAKK